VPGTTHTGDAVHHEGFSLTICRGMPFAKKSFVALEAYGVDLLPPACVLRYDELHPY
jgi:hypothetical protein